MLSFGIRGPEISSVGKEKQVLDLYEQLELVFLILRLVWLSFSLALILLLLRTAYTTNTS